MNQTPHSYSVASPLPEIASISAAQWPAFSAHQPVLLLDNRQAQDFATEHATAAESFFSAATQAKLAQWPKEQAIVVICYRGNSSKKIVTHLMAAGYEAVYNFTGGFAAWCAAGLPKVRPA